MKKRIKQFLWCLVFFGGAAQCGFMLQDARADIYYYKNEDGGYSFSNRRTSRKFRKYARVLAVYKNFPKADHSKVLRIVRIKAGKYGVDARLVQAVIQVESNFKHDAVSHAGARGIMQIMPETGKTLGLKQPFNISDNIDAGVRYLKIQLDTFKSIPLALAAYNAGPGAVKKYKGIPPYRETENYVKKVTSIYNALKQGKS